MLTQSRISQDGGKLGRTIIEQTTKQLFKGGVYYTININNQLSIELIIDRLPFISKHVMPGFNKFYQMKALLYIIKCVATCLKFVCNYSVTNDTMQKKLADKSKNSNNKQFNKQQIIHQIITIISLLQRIYVRKDFKNSHRLIRPSLCYFDCSVGSNKYCIHFKMKILTVASWCVRCHYMKSY